MTRLDTPALEHLMGAYFHQDWLDVHGSLERVVDDYVIGSPVDAPALVAEIATVLAAHPVERDLAEFLFSLGCDYHADPAHGGYRAWLAELARLAPQALSRPRSTT